ncbi:RluA family pseudouridine synthase [Caldimonas tepidiphila]|uniref:RluA family pseudouridine synthase n=1 Tax=Caldimonas tepidiphila TaxID=2315841 RepID=UPI000E5A70EE|nr:RluA family pseudouridine synthase [Caldimonas tepidiphila]
MEQAPPTEPPLELLHADEALLVLVKPAGLLAVPGRGEDKQDCLAARAQACFPDARVVHRLDMSTSGLMLMARGDEAQRRLGRAFETRRVHKRYVALVDGRLGLAGGGWRTLELPLACDWPNRPRQIVSFEHGKPAVTRWRVLAHDLPPGTTRVELEPVTGRSHQLRVHMRALGHPMLGDALYASPAVQALAPRLLLHAWRLELEHPASGAAMEFECPPPF